MDFKMSASGYFCVISFLLFMILASLTGSADSYLGFVLLWFAMLLYLLPSFMAAERQHRNTAPIILTNLIFGWTALGWIIALIWSCTDNTRVPS